MKFYLKILSFFLLVTACSDKTDKLIESKYIFVTNDNSRMISLEEQSGGNVFEQLLNMGKTGKLVTPANSDLLYYRLYINKKGNVDSVRILHNEGKPFSVDKNNTEKIRKWKFIVNENMKYKLDYVFTDLEIEQDVYHRIMSPDEISTMNTEYPDEVSELPGIIGGVSALASLIKYPEQAKRSGLEGSVFVKAFINTAGEVDKVMVIRGIGAGCDLAALTAVCKTKFTPASDEGILSKVQVIVPIKFKLSD